MSDRRKFLEGIVNKLPMLLGGAVAISSANALTQTNGASIATPAAEKSSGPAPKLILNQQPSGADFRLVTQHDSHSSHASHSSHSSHSSSAY